MLESICPMGGIQIAKPLRTAAQINAATAMNCLRETMKNNQLNYTTETTPRAVPMEVRIVISVWITMRHTDFLSINYQICELRTKNLGGLRPRLPTNLRLLAR